MLAPITFKARSGKMSRSALFKLLWHGLMVNVADDETLCRGVGKSLVDDPGADYNINLNKVCET